MNIATTATTQSQHNIGKIVFSNILFEYKFCFEFCIPWIERLHTSKLGRKALEERKNGFKRNLNIFPLSSLCNTKRVFHSLKHKISPFLIVRSEGQEII